jgi:hypothetical protein
MEQRMRGMNPMSDEPDGYQTYLLRLWRVPHQGKWQWRASLESRHTGERQLFATVEQLFAFLSERCSQQEGEMAPPRARGAAARRVGERETRTPG